MTSPLPCPSNFPLHINICVHTTECHIFKRMLHGNPYILLCTVLAFFCVNSSVPWVHTEPCRTCRVQFPDLYTKSHTTAAIKSVTSCCPYCMFLSAYYSLFCLQKDISLYKHCTEVFHPFYMIACLFGCQTFCRANVHCVTVTSMVML